MGGQTSLPLKWMRPNYFMYSARAKFRGWPTVVRVVAARSLLMVLFLTSSKSKVTFAPNSNSLRTAWTFSLRAAVCKGDWAGETVRSLNSSSGCRKSLLQRRKLKGLVVNCGSRVSQIRQPLATNSPIGFLGEWILTSKYEPRSSIHRPEI